MFTVRINHRAEKELARLPWPIQRKIKTIIANLEFFPANTHTIKISGSKNLFRTRFGNYRLIYLVDSYSKQITVIGIGHRKDIYRNL